MSGSKENMVRAERSGEPANPSLQIKWMMKVSVVKLPTLSFPDPGLPSDTSYESFIKHVIREVVGIYGASEKTEFPEDEVFLHKFEIEVELSAEEVELSTDERAKGRKTKLFEIEQPIYLNKVIKGLLNQPKFEPFEVVQKAKLRQLMRPFADYAFEYLKEHADEVETNLASSYKLTCSKAKEVAFDFANGITMDSSVEQRTD